MSLITTCKELDAFFESRGRKNKTLGFVPTMGCLHEGHLSLIRASHAQNDLTAVSVFVNPIQFGPGEDFEKYPRDIQRDCQLALSAGADVVLHPDVSELYAPGFSTRVEVQGGLTKKLCALSRPQHFGGVTTVVNLLFNIVGPDKAYFGQKDAQQALVVQKMVRDLHMRVQVVVCPIVREADGLAMSSRNRYLTPQERAQAPCLHRGLEAAQKSLAEGCTEVQTLLSTIRREIEREPLSQVEYIELLDAETLEAITSVAPGRAALAAVAVRFGGTRLIDNAILRANAGAAT